MKKIILISIVLLGLSGCAVQSDKLGVKGVGLTYSSNIQERANQTYYTEAEAALFAGRIGGALKVVKTDAGIFCRDKGKGLEILEETTESHLLLNGVAKLTFKCI
jgi:hypothetical protein